MAKMIKVRPINGARILDPDAIPSPEVLPKEGKIVEDSSYWRRRKKAREVEILEVSTPESKNKKSKGSD